MPKRRPPKALKKTPSPGDIERFANQSDDSIGEKINAIHRDRAILTTFCNF